MCIIFLFLFFAESNHFFKVAMLRMTPATWYFCNRHLVFLIRKRTFHCTSFLAKNHYEVLGVTRNASKEDIKVAFVTLSKKYHPDLNPDLEHASNSFIEVKEAYAVLSSPLKRQEYDTQLHTLDAYSAQFSNRTYAGSAPRSSGFPFGNPNMTDAHTNEYSRPYDYEFDVGADRRAPHRPNHAKVIWLLILIMLVGSVVHTFRIKRAHRIHQERSQAESRRNYHVYAQVRERARTSSIHEQLDRLSRRQSDTLQKVVPEDSGK